MNMTNLALDLAKMFHELENLDASEEMLLRYENEKETIDDIVDDMLNILEHIREIVNNLETNLEER